MSVDTSPLGILCASVMEEMAGRFGDDAAVITVAVVVEVETAKNTQVLVAATDQRPWVQLAFLGEGIAAVEQRIDELCEEED